MALFSAQMFRRLLGLIAFGCWHLLSAQHAEFHFEHFGNAEGLSYNTVNTLYQDQLDQLWIGTWDGLCTFDGYEFACRYQDQGNLHSIPMNEINDVFVDAKNNLCIGTKAGIFRQAYGKEFQHFPRLSGIPIGTLSPFGESFLIANLYPITHPNPKLILLNMETEYSEIHDLSKHGLHAILNILVDGSSVWLATKNGTVLYDPVQKKIQHDFPNVEVQLQGHEIWSLCHSKAGDIYFASRNEVFFKPAEQDSLIQLPPLPTLGKARESISCIYSDHKNDLWVGTSNGLLHWSWKTENWLGIRHDPSDPFSLSDNDVTCLLEDRSNMLWIGTQNGGLNKLNLKTKPFHNFRTAAFGTEEIVKVFSFERQSESCLWVGTNQGLFLFDRRAKKILKRFEIPNLGEKAGEAATIMSICQSKTGPLLIGTRGLGLFAFDAKTETFHSLNEKTNCIGLNNAIRAIHENEKGHWWLISSGLYIIDPSRPVWTCQEFSASYPMEGLHLPAYYLWNLYQENENIYWIATKMGWARWDLAAEQTRISQNPNQTAIQNSQVDTRAIFCMEPAANGFWLGTYGSGLILLDTANDLETIYTTQHGLANNHVYGILKTDESPHLWMSTNRGISQFEPGSRSFRNFDLADGLRIREFESNSYFKTADGEFFFGGKDGFVQFKPDEFQANSFKVCTKITSFKVFGQELSLDSSILEKKYIQLASSQNFFEIRFSAFDFTNPQANRYEYQLFPFQQDWVAIEGEHSVQYTDLSPGKYDFQLRATNSDGVYEAETKHLYIEVVPAFYQQAWFIVLVTLLVLAAYVVIVRQRLRLIRQRDKLRLQEATSELENETLRASLNEHFTFNSLNSIQSFIARNDKEKALHYIGKFGRLIRLSLENSKTQFHSLADEVEMLSLYLELERLRLEEKFVTSIQISPEIDPNTIEIPAMLIQPFLENAIWHGISSMEMGGKITLDISIAANALYILLQDNGVGRAQAQQNKAQSALKHQSKGMRLLKERLQLLNVAHQKDHRFTVTDCVDAAQNPQGTKVEIWIPLKTEA